MEKIKAKEAQLRDVITHQGEMVIIQSIIPYGNRVRLKVMYPDGSLVSVTMPLAQTITLLDRA